MMTSAQNARLAHPGEMSRVQSHAICPVAASVVRVRIRATWKTRKCNRDTTPGGLDGGNLQS